MAQKLKAVLFISSVREGRNADRVVALTKKELEANGFTVKVFDPKVMQLPLLQNPIHFYPDPTKAPKQLQEANEEIKQADAFVFVTAEYNRGVPPALSNLIDHFSPAAYAWKPAMPVSYSAGPGAGHYATAALLPIFRELGLTATPAVAAIPTVDKALSADGQVQSGFEYVKRTLELTTSQLLWLANTLKKAREDPARKPPKSQPWMQ
jgi:NAD(P)H-dependent FMN reductase